ncbi:tRNA lysidine(34) synthetase TilS [Thermovenabulum gondwanense]|uniref:tRNA(Ile)-lysidine synthase n=1 Tax=Thermovenabulum gondwanense TaxID=520767 RepID=A0A162N4E4_9FIRM|nr:tRNA lysidine(34) synthetase TilS [Thermovenabulum gondwanense]KYO69286.1 tRNA(Ile)-lysidine synthase [Thermovenabulum gondwanense]
MILRGKIGIKEKFLETIKKYDMIRTKDKIIIGLSGGPDSVCLLDLFCSIREEFQLEVFAAHLNHCFRGRESDEDEEFAKALCEKYNVKFFSKRVNVPEIIEKTGLSPEDAARRVRYDFLFEIKEKLNADKIAVGHNMNDHEETVLMNIFRGTGTEGLIGIEPKRGCLIRPLIEIERTNIEDYLKKHNIPYRIDSTNLKTEYYRNKIRLELIPYIKQKFCPHFSDAVKRLSDIVALDVSFIESIIENIYPSLVTEGENFIKLHIKPFEKQPTGARYRILRKVIGNILGELKDIEFNHIKSLDEFIIEQSPGKMVELPRGICGEKGYEEFYFYIKGQIKDFSYVLNIPGEIYITEIGKKISAELLDRTTNFKLKATPLKVFVDYGKIRGNLIVRNRRPGDRFFPFGFKFSKKLQDFFVDQKIPSFERNLVPIVENEGKIVWVGGFRLDDRFKIDDNTTQILILEIK